MIVIRRMVDRQRSYTGIFLPGEEGIINDFTDLDAVTPAAPNPAPSAPVKPKKRQAAARKSRRTQS